MPSQIVQAGEPLLTAHVLESTSHVLVLWSMTRHVSAEIAALAVQPLMTDRTVHAIPTVMARQVVIANLLVHEALGATGKGAFPRPFFIRYGKMFLRDVASQCGFAGKRGGAQSPIASHRALRTMTVLDVLFQVFSA